MSDKKQPSANLDRVVGRALRDERFRASLAEDPKAALKGEGLTDEDLEAVSGGALNAYSEVASLNFSKIQTGLLLPAVQKVRATGDGSV